MTKPLNWHIYRAAGALVLQFVFSMHSQFDVSTLTPCPAPTNAPPANSAK